MAGFVGDTLSGRVGFVLLPPTPDQAWKVGGLLYFNPHDPASWVLNRVGPGYTLNVSNWRAWLLIIGIMLAPMIATRLLF